MKPISLVLAAAAILPAWAHAAYTPTPVEAAVLEHGIREETATLMKGRQGLLGRMLDLQALKAEWVAELYAKGPTAKLPAELEEAFVLETAVDSAAAKAGQVVFPKSPGAAVQLQLPPDTQAADALTLLCRKLAWADGVVTFSNCEPWKPLAEKTVADFRADIASFLQGKPMEPYVARFVIDYFVVANEMPGVSGCPDDRAACDAAIRKTSMTRGTYQTVEQRLQAAGVNTSR